MTKGQGSNSRSVDMGSGCGMFSDDIGAEATRVYSTAEERGLAPRTGMGG